AVGALDLELARRHQRAAAGEEIDLAGLEEELDAADELLHDGVLAGDGLRQREHRALDRDPVLLAVRREPVAVARVEEGLRRDAADRHADAADAVALDERDPRALRPRVERSDVPAGATTEDGDVVALLAHLVEQPSRAGRVSFQRMRAIAAAEHEPEVERDEREADPLVLLGVPALVQPQSVARLVRADDHVAERDG